MSLKSSKYASMVTSLDGLTSVDRLSYEIFNLMPLIALDESEEKQRQNVINELESELKAIAPEYKLVIYGSFAYNLSLKNSDLDFSLVSLEGRSLNKEAQMELLDSIMERLNTDKWTNLEFIPARVPIIKMKDKTYGIPCDIS